MSLSGEWPFIQSQEAKFFMRYVLPLIAVVLALEINWLVAPFLSFLPPFLTFLAAIMLTAWYGGFPSAVFATVISALVIDFYFIPPLYVFNVKPADWGTLGFFAGEAMTMAYCIDYLQKSRQRAVKREKQLQRLQELSGRLIEETTLDSMLDEVLKASIELLGADKAVIQLYESRDHVLRLIKQIGFTKEFSARFERVPIGSFSCGTAFERKQRVIIENVVADPDFSQLTPLFHEFGVVGAQSTPLFNPDGMVFGVLSTYWSSPYRPSTGDLQLLDLYAHQAERILLYKRNEELLYQANEELERHVTRKQILLMERDVKLTKLLSELLLTEERERRELSGELHDSLAQLLTLAKMKLGLAEGSLSKATDKAEQYIRETKQVLERSLRFTRTLMAEFNPPDFDQLGLSGALVWLKDRMQQHDLLVTLHVECESVVLPRNHVVLLYKCIRELLMNVVKHAKVKTATITVKMNADHALEITVQDQGLGFRPSTETPPIPGHHFGLRSVRERVEDMGGRFHLESEIGQGCMVTLVLPLGEIAEFQQGRAAQTTRRDRVIEKPKHDPHQETLPLR
jgi:signal transduction histidine kinase